MLSALIHVAFIHESSGGIKHATFPFESVELYLLMAMGVGSALITSLALLGRFPTAPTYIAAHLATAYFVFPLAELKAAVAFTLLGLVPLLITTLILRLVNR